MRARTMTARFDGPCGARCDRGVKRGDCIRWERGAPARHLECASPLTGSAPLPKLDRACTRCGAPLIWGVLGYPSCPPCEKRAGLVLADYVAVGLGEER